MRRRARPSSSRFLVPILSAATPCHSLRRRRAGGGSTVRVGARGGDASALSSTLGKKAGPPSLQLPLCRSSFPFRNRESRAPADPQAAGQRLDQGLGLQRRGALPPRLRVARRLKPDAARRLICIAIRDIVFFRACSLEELNDLIDALSPLTTPPVASRRRRHA